MKIHYTKSDAVAEANARRAAGETVKVMKEIRHIPGSGDHAPRNVARFFVVAA